MVDTHLYQNINNKLDISDRISSDASLVLSKEKYIIDCIKIKCSIMEIIGTYKSCVNNCLSSL